MKKRTMKRRYAEFLVLNVLRALKDEGDDRRRSKLFSLGESILTEYKDMEYKPTKKAVEKLCDGGELYFSDEVLRHG